MKVCLLSKCSRQIILSCCLILMASLLLAPLAPVDAQDNSGTLRYENQELGVAFDIPTNWLVRVEEEELVAGTEFDFAEYDRNVAPPGIVFSIVFGTFGRLNIANPSQLPAQVVRLVPSGITATEPVKVTYGNVSGYETEFVVPDGGYTSRVALLTLPGGRLAIVRGLAAQSSWENGGSDQFERIVATLQFSLPATGESPFANILDNDGGVMWHYQSGQPSEGQPLELGGMAYDSFGVLYIAAGPRGFLALSQTDGAFINFLGPFRDDDNFVDVALSVDERLYFANASAGDNERIMVIDRAGNYMRSWGIAGESPGQFAAAMPQTLAISSRGDVWAISEGHSVAPINRLYRFDSFGNYISMIDLATINPQLASIKMDIDRSSGNLILMGQQGGVNLLDSEGNPIVTRINEELLEAAVPLEVTVAPGSVLVIATEKEGFLGFTAFGELLDRFGFLYDTSRGDAFKPGEYWQPHGLTVGQDSTVYFAETHPQTGFAQVQSFRFSGEGELPLVVRAEAAITSDEAGIDALSVGGPISYGETVRGRLSNQNTYHDYTFEARAGDRLLITMRDISTDQQLDTAITLLDVNYDDVAFNDDATPPIREGWRGTDSVLTFVVGVNGTYIIRAGRFGGMGEYELTLSTE